MQEKTFFQETVIYAKRMNQFDHTDWIVYIIWIGLMLGLLGSVSYFLGVGAIHGVNYPIYVWNIPLGIFIFASAIAFDTIGHRTVYKEYLAKVEALVHHVTIFAGITSTVMLCLAYHWPVFMRIPTLVMIILSVFYSVVDEALHWHRYFNDRSDRVEMVSHFFIFLGHMIMIFAWWQWYSEGYPGVLETVAHL